MIDMAIGSGMGGSVGYSKESVYGTRVAPTKFLVANSASVNLITERPQGEGVKAGAFGPNAAHFVEAHSHGEATIQSDVPHRGFGGILELLMGGTPAKAKQGAHSAWKHTFPLGDTLGKSATIQNGVPQRDGTVRVHELQGAKVESVEFSCERGGLLSANMKFDGRAFDQTQVLAAVSYVAGIGAFSGADMSIKAGNLGSETEIGARSTKAQFERPLDTGAFVSGQARKLEPVLNGATNLSGDVTIDFTATGGKRIQDFVVSNELTSLVIEWVGKKEIVPASSLFPTLTLKIPCVAWSGDVQGIDGAGELQSTFNWEWKDDHTNVPTIEYTTADENI